MTSADPGPTGAEHPQDLSLCEQARAIAAGQLDATELLEATLARIEERDDPLNSIADSFASESA
jgi:Asp-tRNA(Asn)/Glu-tRNA(Gln) amidotransferase A subunit family amidase